MFSRKNEEIEPFNDTFTTLTSVFAGRVGAESSSMIALDSAQPLHPVSSQTHADTSKTRSITN